MKNKIVDLNNHLFAQLERLGDENLTSEQVDLEVRRSEAIVAVSEQVIRSADVTLRATKLIAENGGIGTMNARVGGALTPLIDAKAEAKAP